MDKAKAEFWLTALMSYENINSKLKKVMAEIGIDEVKAGKNEKRLKN